MKFQLSKYIKESFSSSKLYQLAEMAPYVDSKTKTIRETLMDILDKFPDDQSKEIPEEAKKLIKEKIFDNPKVKMDGFLKTLSYEVYINPSALYNLNDSDFYEYSYDTIKKVGFKNIVANLEKKKYEGFHVERGSIIYFWIFDDKIVAISTGDRLKVVGDDNIYNFDDYEKLVDTDFNKQHSKNWKDIWMRGIHYFTKMYNVGSKSIGQPLSPKSNLQTFSNWGTNPMKSRLIAIIPSAESWNYPITHQRSENKSLTYKGEKVYSIGAGRDFIFSDVNIPNKKSYNHNDPYNQYFQARNYEYYQKALKSRESTIFLRNLQPDLDKILKEYSDYIASTISKNFDISSFDRNKDKAISSNMENLVKSIGKYKYLIQSSYSSKENIKNIKDTILDLIKKMKELLAN